MADRTSVVPVTLSFVTTDRQVLLLKVAPHKDRFAGCWNGVGGHVGSAESVRAAALREIREETGLTPGPPELRAVLHEPGLLGRPHLLFVFRARIGRAEAPGPCAEGTLAWFDHGALPEAELVPDLRELLPAVLFGRELIYGVQHFDGGDRALRLELEG